MNLLIFIFVLSILVISHEYGHFIAARLHGIKVERFAFGFGPPLLKFTLKDTELLICAVFLGGYVKMAGDTRNEQKGSPDEFFSKPLGVRANVVGCGPLFNFILALLIFWIIFMTGSFFPQPIVGDTYLEPVEISEFSPSQLRALTQSGVLTESEGETGADSFYYYRAVETEGELRQKLVAQGISDIDKVGSLLKKTQYPAYVAGVKKNDVILEVNGNKVKSWEDSSTLIRESTDLIALTLSRDNEIKTLHIVPRKGETSVFVWFRHFPFLRLQKKEISYIGITPYYKEIRLNPWDSFIQALKRIYMIIALLTKGLLLTIAGVLPFKEAFAGPVGIFKIGGEVAKLGMGPLFNFIGILSVSLGLINLFPIPVLDGGHLLFMGIEKIRGKPISQKGEDILTWIGITFLALLLLYASYNDIIRWVVR